MTPWYIVVCFFCAKDSSVQYLASQLNCFTSRSLPHHAVHGKEEPEDPHDNGYIEETAATDVDPPPLGGVVSAQPTTYRARAATLRLDRTLQRGRQEAVRQQTLCWCSPRGPSRLARLQAPAVASVRPAQLCCQHLRQHTELWEFPDAGPEIAFMHTVDAIGQFTRPTGERMIVHHKDRAEQNIVVHVYTKRDFLDVLTIRFRRYNPATDRYYDSGCIAAVESASTNLVPAGCPLALCWGILGAWVPFRDGGTNIQRVHMLRNQVQSTITMNQL